MSIPKVPFDFVLEALFDLSPKLKPMFGCMAVYVESNRMVLVLRKRNDHPNDNGVWIVTETEHHKTLKRDFPSMRTIELFGSEVSAWQVIPETASDFESSVIKACELILKRDPRIGKLSFPKRM